jgi:magnesium transporter
VASIMRRHAGTGLLNGAIVALAAAGLTFLLLGTGIFASDSEPAQVVLVVGLAVMVNLVIATLAGTAIPLILRALGQDPALASSIFLTTITDVVGFGGFLLVATVLLS